MNGLEEGGKERNGREGQRSYILGNARMLLFGEAGDEVAAETVEFGYGKDNGLG
jgi:hypothetical protein